MNSNLNKQCLQTTVTQVTSIYRQLLKQPVVYKQIVTQVTTVCNHVEQKNNSEHRIRQIWRMRYLNEGIKMNK